MMKTEKKCQLCEDTLSPETITKDDRCFFIPPLEASLKGDILILSCYVEECAREIRRFKVTSKMPNCGSCEDIHAPRNLALHGRCHPGAPVKATWEKDQITLSCYIPECGKLIVRFAVEKIEE